MDYWVIPSIVHNKETVQVPDLINLKREEAHHLLDSLQLIGIDAGSKMDAKIKPGRIAVQTPLANSIVRKGRHVYLVVSGGEEKVKVPLLRGKSIRDARFALESVGLFLGETTFSLSEDFPPGTILAQEIAVDANISRGMKVNVVASQGKSSDRVHVPDVTKKKTLKEAIAYLKSLNFTIGKITYEPTLDLPPNIVLDQYPVADELVPFGQTIDLFVSQEKVKVTEH